MQLFKRLLLSLFPSDTITGNINPASIFVSFISSKEFFSIIHRKLVENYKLNQFDIALDPFEFKIWFWNNPTVHVQDIDLYYGYAWSANINWYRVYNPSTIWYSIALVTSVYIKESFNTIDAKYFIHFNYTVLLLTFIFASRIKSFPKTTKEEKFNWFINTFFSLYEIVFLQTNTSFEKKEIEKVKKQLFENNDIFFMLQVVYEKINNIFDVSITNQKEYYERLFYDESKEGWSSDAVQDFIKNCSYYNQQSTFSITEKKILPLVLPADILMRYLYSETDPYKLTTTVIGSIYDKKTIEKYIKSFRSSEKEIENFLTYITDYSIYRKWFFEWIRKYITSQNTQDYNIEESEEIDDFMSSIGDIEKIDMAKIPEKLKRESRFMEKILNFYISFVWWLWIARWDNFAMKLYKRDFIKEVTKWQKIITDKKYSLQNYWALLYSYSKNSFYYKYAAENVRAGKEKFYVPFSNTLKKAQSNIYIIKLLHENFIATIFQDINQKDTRIYVKNKDIIETFKQMFWVKISKYINKEKDILKYVYEPIYNKILQIENLEENITMYFNENDIRNIKDSLYTLDFWLRHHFCYKIWEKWEQLEQDYIAMNIAGIIAQARETLLWLLLYIYYNEKHDTKNIDIIIELYIVEILHLADHYVSSIAIIIKEIYLTYYSIIEKWISLDDNTKYIDLAINNWNKFTKWMTKEQIKNNLIGEDIMRLRGFLKNISYYNKRFVIPQ